MRVCTSVITVTRLLTVTDGVDALSALLDLVVTDGVEVVIARLMALALWLDDANEPDIVAMFASLPVFTMPGCVSVRLNDRLAFITHNTTSYCTSFCLSIYLRLSAELCSCKRLLRPGTQAQCSEQPDSINQSINQNYLNVRSKADK